MTQAWRPYGEEPGSCWSKEPPHAHLSSKAVDTSKNGDTGQGGNRSDEVYRVMLHTRPWRLFHATPVAAASATRTPRIFETSVVIASGTSSSGLY